MRNRGQRRGHRRWYTHRWNLTLVLLMMVSLGSGGGCGGGEEGQSASSDVGQAASGQESAEPGTIRANRPPEARLEVLHVEGYAGMTHFRLDASPSTDDLNLSSEMAKRWDYDGDGSWDSNFSRANRVTHIYPDSGLYRPRLLVRDSGGLVDSVAGPQLTVHGSCPPPDFALVDMNPNSETYAETCRLSDMRGQRVVLWLASPSK